MLLLLRKILFYIFFVAYFLITPYVILYGLGYVFNPKEEGLVKTGLISVATHPKGASIYINGKKFHDKTPTMIGDLVPGNYLMKIDFEGHEPWEKTVTVRPEKAVAYKHTVLLPKKAKEKKVSTRTYAGMVSDLVDGKIFIWETGAFQDLWKLDLFFKREQQVGKSVSGFDSLKLISARSEKNSPLILFDVVTVNGKEQLAWDFSNEKNKPILLTPWLNGKVDGFGWDSSTGSNLFYAAGGGVGKIDLEKKQGHPKLAENILGFGIKEKRLYLLKSDYSLVTVNLKGENPEPLIEDSVLSQKIFGTRPDRFYEIKVIKRDLLKNDLILFLGNQGSLITNRLPYSLIDKGVRGTSYAEEGSGERVLYWTEREIGVIQFKGEEEQFFQNGPEQKILYSSGTDIRKAFWVLEDSHIVFLEGEKIMLLETEGENQFLARQIANIKSTDPVIYRANALYYLDPATNRLIKRELIE